jgi:heptaprenyl diphosphate synthase
LALATATAGRRDATQEDLLGGVAVELVHLASLYHDDVIDEATIRRNVESVNSRFGNLVAIVAGDYLLARSAAIAAGLGTEIAALLADTLGKLCQGQVSEVRSAFQTARSQDEYFVAIGGKTAALMATSARIGALTGGLSAPEVEAATEYGFCLGMVFQIRDDILDVTATEGELQKPAGQDLAEGIYTLPALIALDDPHCGPDLHALLGQPLAQPEREKARAIVSQSPGIAHSVGVARDYVARAQLAADGIGTAELRQGLGRLATELLVDLPG